MGDNLFINNDILLQKHFFVRKDKMKQFLEYAITNIIKFVLFFGKTHESECFQMK